MPAPLAALLAGLALLATAPFAGAVVPGSYVVVQNFQFDPPVATVAPGGAVTWDSEEPVVHHNLVAFDGTFLCHLTADGQPGETCTVAIPGASGTLLGYRCSIHPFMLGFVLVT